MKAVEVLAALFGGGSVEEDIQAPDMRDLPYSRTNPILQIYQIYMFLLFKKKHIIKVF